MLIRNYDYMLVFKRIVDTDFADINFLREERPLDDGFLIPSQRHGDILEGIYLVTFSVGDENVYQYMVFFVVRCQHIIVSEQHRTIARLSGGRSIHRARLTNWFGVCVSTL